MSASQHDNESFQHLFLLFFTHSIYTKLEPVPSAESFCGYNYIKGGANARGASVPVSCFV